jgi:ABC-type branched-subunit amino acid transport system ATPase component
MLRLSDLTSGYGRIPILHRIGFEVAEGECLGVWGHNGMGKTTLLTSIMGHQPATGGHIEFRGKDITRAPTHMRARMGLGLVPQGRQIFPALTVLENLRMGSVGVAESATLEDVLELFPRLKPLLARAGGFLSGGEQQLLALARCLCGQPKLLMLDEPTEGIQPSINEEIVETLQKLRAEKRLTMVLVEQRRDFLAALASRVLVIQKGQIARSISPKELLDLQDIH